MGAGCPEKAETLLFHEALKLKLGFSEFQLSSAIKHLVKEFGSLEDGPALIRQDNFTVLVNYILDNADTLIQETPQGNSNRAVEQTKQVKISETEQKNKGGKSVSPLKKRGQELIGFVSHAQKKGRVSEPKITKEIVEARTLIPSGCHDLASGNQVWKNNNAEVKGSNTIANRRPTGKSQMFQTEVVMMQSAENKVAANGICTSAMNNLATGHESYQTVRNSKAEVRCSTLRRPTVKLEMLQTEATQQRAKKRESADGFFTSADNDHATVASNSSAEVRCSNNIENRRPTGKLEMFQTEFVAKQSAEKKELPNGKCTSAEKFVNLDTKENIPSSSSRIKNRDTNCKMRKLETCEPDLLSLRSEQKASCSAACKSVVEVSGSEDLFLDQLETFLKEGNCLSALEVLKAWKTKKQQVDTRQTEDMFLQGEGHEMVPAVPGKKKGFVVSYDVSRGLEKLPISCVNEYNTDVLPDNFLYITRSVIRQYAHVDISFSRIGDLHCCCSDDCLRSSEACKCTDATRGEYAYDETGRLIERLAFGFVSGCRTINGDFITECCDKCCCSMKCGNRIVQRGITKKLQVFMTPKKGWGVRALEKIPARSFVFEYLGEIATNSEQYDRNLEYKENGVYTYVMCLDADLDMENKHFKDGLNDHEALVLDATIFGNVSRFVNHRCDDANLFMRPVQIETRDTHYYHAALFATRDIEEMEELTWDYGIDFEDDTHLLKAFKCLCQSSLCRDKANHLKQEKGRKGKLSKLRR